ncbi:MAG: aldo/keto reductase [bacterium]|nr:aldo/keto reductase [bacterium]
MKYKLLGHSELLVSELCLGTMTMGWQNDERESFEILTYAFDHGIQFIDTADVYSRWVPGNPGGVSETIIGNWIKKRGIPRHDLILATKVRGRMWDGEDGEGLSAKHIARAIDDSLRRLQMDTVDLYQCHAPDYNTPIQETWYALSQLVKDGKVRYLGLSNYNGAQHLEIIQFAKSEGLPLPVSTQPKYNLTVRGEVELDLVPIIQKYRIGMIPYSPLEGGLLTGKYRRDQDLPHNARHTLNGRALEKLTDQVVEILRILERIAKERNVSMAAVAIAWMQRWDWMTSPIIGATSIQQLQESLQSTEFTLTDEEWQWLSDASQYDEQSIHFIQRGPVT